MVGLKVDFDLQLTPMASSLYRMMANKVGREDARAQPKTLFRNLRDLGSALMATSNSPTCGHSNSPRQDGRIMGFLTLSELTCEAVMPGGA
jgi:hypothetical protein